MIALISTLCVTAQPCRDVRTFSVDSAGIAVHKIEQRAGIKISIDRSLSQHVILTDFKVQETKPELEAIACAVHGTLIQTEDGYQIVRTQQNKQGIAQERKRVRVGWLEERLRLLEGWRAQMLHQPLDKALNQFVDEQDRRMEILRRTGVDNATGFFAPQLTPSEILLEDLVKRVGLSKIAGLPSGSVEIFEDDPVSIAHPLPEHGDLIAKYGNLAAHLSKITDETKERLNTAQQILSFPTAEQIKSLRLVVSADSQVVLCMLEGFDKDEKRVLIASLQAGPTQALTDFSTTVKQNSTSMSAMGQLSQTSKQALDYLGLVRDAEETVPRKPLWLSQPSKEDPLSLHVGDVFDAIVRNDPGDFKVVDLSDYLWYTWGSLSDKLGSFSVDAAKALLRPWLPYEHIQGANFTVYRPLDPDYEDLRRASRQALEKYSVAMDKGEEPDLRKVSLFLKEACPEQSELARDWIRLCDQKHPFRFSVLGLPWNYYQLAGSISESDWGDLIAGSPKTARALGVVPQLVKICRESMWSMFSFPVDDALPAPPKTLPDRYLFTPELSRFGNIETSVISVNQMKTLMLRPPEESKRPRDGWGPIRLFSNRFPIGFLKVEESKNGLQVTTHRDRFFSPFVDKRIQLGVSDDITIAIKLPGNQQQAKTVAQGFSVGEVVKLSQLDESVLEGMWRHICERELRYAKDMRNPANKITDTTTGPKPEKPS